MGAVGGSAHLAALAGADPIVVPRGLVLAHEAGLVDAGQGWGRGGAGHDLLRAGALRLDSCGERVALRAWSPPRAETPQPAPHGCSPAPGVPAAAAPAPRCPPRPWRQVEQGQQGEDVSWEDATMQRDISRSQRRCGIQADKKKEKKSKEKGRDPRSPQPKQHCQRMGERRVQGRLGDRKSVV